MGAILICMSTLKAELPLLNCVMLGMSNVLSKAIFCFILLLSEHNCEGWPAACRKRMLHLQPRSLALQTTPHSWTQTVRFSQQPSCCFDPQ